MAKMTKAAEVAAAERRSAAEIEQHAATVTIRQDVRFLRWWLAVATAASFFGNVGDAVLTLVSDADPVTLRWTRFMLTVVWAAFAPTLLMLAIHGVPVTRRLLSHLRDADLADNAMDHHRTLLAIVIGVVVGALGWSAVHIHGFGIWLETGEVLSWLAPVVIDLSVAGAMLALVQASPITARLKAREAHERATGLVHTEPLGAQLSGAPVRSADAQLSAPTTRPTADPTRLSGAPGGTQGCPARSAQLGGAQAVSSGDTGARTATVHRVVDGAEHADTSADAPLGPQTGAPADEHLHRARQLVDAGVTQLPVHQVAPVVASLTAGTSQTETARTTGVNRRTVAKIAAGIGEDDGGSTRTDPSTRRPLAAVAMS